MALFHHMMQWHNRWVLGLLDCLDGDEVPDPQDYGRDDLCELGWWLTENEERFGGDPAFQRLTLVHRKMHYCAGKIVECRNRCDTDKVEALKVEYEKMRLLLVNGFVQANELTEGEDA